MKKIISVAVCLAMLFSLMAIMPATATEEVNLIVNGDFEAEADAIGSTSITGWTNGNEENKFSVVARGAGKAVDAANDSNRESGEKAGDDLPDAKLYQTVTIDTTKAWYTDYENYKYVLSYEGYAASDFISVDSWVATVTAGVATGTTPVVRTLPASAGQMLLLDLEDETVEAITYADVMPGDVFVTLWEATAVRYFVVIR